MREVLKCVEMRGGLQNFETELLPPSLLFLPSALKIAPCQVQDLLTHVYIFSPLTVCTHTSLCVCVFVCFSEDIFIAFYKRVPSAAIQSPPPPLGFSTPNIMSFILSVKIID